MLVWMDEEISEERARELIAYFDSKSKEKVKDIPEDMLFKKVLVDHNKKRYRSCVIMKEMEVKL